MELTLSASRRIEQLPHHLHTEFPQVPLSAIEHDVAEHAHKLIAGAHFDDYIPVLVRRAIRERLQDMN